MSSTVLDEFADESPTPARRWPTWQIVLAAIAIAAGVAAAAWLSFGRAESAVTSEEVAFAVNDAQSVTLTFNVIKPRDMTVLCTLEALSHTYVQVGFQELEFGPAAAEKQQFTTTIPTMERAVTAVVKTCVPQQ